MKHNIKITIILLAMFLAAQIIGIIVVNLYTSNTLPFGFQPPQEMIDNPNIIYNIIISMIIAIALIFLLMKIQAKLFLRLWFFFVVTIGISIVINAVLLKFNISSYYALVIALPLAFFKIFKRNIIVHNLTEILIYPGIAAVFVAILNLPAAIILLILISIYDIYAVWHSGFMMKMARFQINELKIFGGFLIPYLGKKDKEEIQFLKEKYKNKIPKEKLKSKKIKVNLAALGGGDIVFPIILTGVVLRTLGLFQALSITIFATLALVYLFINLEKGKAYPAMPYLTTGCLIGLGISYIIPLIF